MLSRLVALWALEPLRPILSYEGLNPSSTFRGSQPRTRPSSRLIPA